MFRTRFVAKAAAASLVSAAPVSQREINDARTVSRLLGCKEGFGPLATFSSVVEKAGNQPAALIGRAAAYLKRGDAKLALADLDVAVSATKASGNNLYAMAVSLRASTRNQLLDDLESKAQVSGAIEEGEISALRNLVKADYRELDKLRGNCWTTQLAEAEYALYNGEANVALPILLKVQSRLAEEIAARRVTHKSPETGAALEDAVAYRASRSNYCLSDSTGTTNSIVAESMKSHVRDSPLAGDLKTLQGKYGIADLTNDETAALASVYSGAAADHHFYSMFPLNERYATWKSSRAVSLKKKIQNFFAPAAPSNLKDYVENIKKPESAYSGATEEQLKSALASIPKGASVLDHLESSLGSVATSAHSSGDHAFFDAVSAIEERSSQFPTPFSNSDAFARYQDNFITELLDQALYRAQLAEALCLERQGKLEDAVAKLTSIYREDGFLYMWKVLLARGRLYKAIGKIEEGEKDFAELHTLKEMYSGRDLPQLDANRYQSQF